MRKIELYYEEGADPDNQRPRNVRAGSGLCSVSHYLIAVQDDADFLAVIDTRDWTVRGHAIPAGSEHHRLYDDRSETAEPDEKIDLEACITCQFQGEQVVLAFGSGVSEPRERVVIARFENQELNFEELKTPGFHGALNAVLRSEGAELNLEGAILKDDVLQLFSRGDHGENPQDAVLEVDWKQFQRYLESPKSADPPEVLNKQVYKLGKLDDVPLTFSDAEPLKSSGKVLFTASSEDDEDAGASLIGITDGADARAANGSGFPISAKIEGICFLESDPTRLFLIDDQDNYEKASNLYEVKLVGNWL